MADTTPQRHRSPQKHRENLFWLFSVLLWSFCGSVVWVRAEEPAVEPATIPKTKDGLQFQLPPDWPIETRGGITAPIPIEEYLGRKFKAIEAQLQGLAQRQGGLESRMRALEEDVKKPHEGLRSMEQPPAPSAEPAPREAAR